MNDVTITIVPKDQIAIGVLWLICSALAVYHFFVEGRRRLIIPCPTMAAVFVTPMLIISGPVGLMAAVLVMHMVVDMRAMYSPEVVAGIEENYRARNR